MQELNTLQSLAAFAVPGIFAITVHEVSHGLMARRLGDRTAEMLGRLTLNPLKHIDPVGTLLVPTALVLLNLPPFGWARPVPVSNRNFAHPQRGMAMVAAAGPLSNLAMAIGWAIIAKLALLGGAQGPVLQLVYAMGLAGVLFNLVLAVLNMLPLLPLDGGRVLNGFLPPRVSDTFERIEPFGLMILLLLLVTGALWPILRPAIGALLTFIAGAAGIPLADVARVL